MAMDTHDRVCCGGQIMSNFSVVCMENEHLALALNMVKMFQNHTSHNVEFITNDSHTRYVERSDFYFIWNTMTPYNVANNLVEHSPNLKCSRCGLDISYLLYLDYRRGVANCPHCNEVADRGSNFIGIMHGEYPEDKLKEIINRQLARRFWISTWVDHHLFTNFIQAITYIPHVTISEDIDAAIFEDEYYFIDKEDQPFTQLTIDSMAAGIPIFGDVSSYVLSMYPGLPIIPMDGGSETYVVNKFYSNGDNAKAHMAYERKFAQQWFSPKRVAKQWEFLAKFIMNPICRFDRWNLQEGDTLPYPLYWGLQGGY